MHTNWKQLRNQDNQFHAGMQICMVIEIIGNCRRISMVIGKNWRSKLLFKLDNRVCLLALMKAEDWFDRNITYNFWFFRNRFWIMSYRFSSPPKDHANAMLGCILESSNDWFYSTVEQTIGFLKVEICMIAPHSIYICFVRYHHTYVTISTDIFKIEDTFWAYPLKIKEL